MTTAFDIIPIGEWGLFSVPPRPCVIAGPCSAESEEQVMETARGLKAAGMNVFRAGLWKPRTHPGCFEGVGAEGLEWLRKVKTELGMTVATEVAGGVHVRECLDAGVDLVWIGARTTANPFLVQEIADALKGTEIPVLVKNPVSPDFDLWVGALERLAGAGVRRMGVIHRGFSTSEKIKYRNDPLWRYVIELRSRFPELPFFCDPSHLAGKREYIGEVSQRAMDLGLDGLMVECHCSPESALSDAAQQLTPGALADLLENRLTVREADSADTSYRETIRELRAGIDALDEELIGILARRMEISRRIGESKRENNIAILQAGRWESVLSDVIARGRAEGLDEDFVRTVFSAIHDASVKAQE